MNEKYKRIADTEKKVFSVKRSGRVERKSIFFFYGVSISVRLSMDTEKQLNMA